MVLGIDKVCVHAVVICIWFLDSTGKIFTREDYLVFSWFFNSRIFLSNQVKTSEYISGKFLSFCKRSIFITIIRYLKLRLLSTSTSLLYYVSLSLKISESKSSDFFETMAGSSPSCSSGWNLTRLWLRRYFELNELIDYSLMVTRSILLSRTTLVWVEIRGLVFTSSMIENSLIAYSILTLACSIVSAWLTNSKLMRSSQGMNNLSSFKIWASEFTGNCDLLNLIATFPEDHWGVVLVWSGISVLLSKDGVIWLSGRWITLQFPFVPTLLMNSASTLEPVSTSRIELVKY